MRYIAAVGAPWGDEVLRRLVPLGIERVGDLHELRAALAVAPVPRYVFFLNWSWWVPRDITGQHECVNFHCTPLPYGRGGHPIENMILRGYGFTCVTAHRMTSQLDAGPIYMTGGPMSLAGSKAEIVARFPDVIAPMVLLLAENRIEPRPQVGEVVEFQRLPQAEYEAFWAARGAAVATT